MSFNHKLIFRTISTLLLLESATMLPSFLCAAMDHDLMSLRAMTLSIGILSLLGVLGLFITKKQTGNQEKATLQY